MYDMANSNRKKARKLQAAKKAKAAEKEKTVKKVKPTEERPIKYTVTAEQQADCTFEFRGGKGGFNIIKQKNKALEPYGKCIHNYGVLLELIPEDKQAAINQQIGNARVVHNDYLSKREEYYKETKKALTVSQYKKEYLPALKDEKEYLKDTDKFVYENACRNVDDAYNRFFKGLSGFPKYASRTKPNGNSFTTNFTNNNILIGKNVIKLPKVGMVKAVIHKLPKDDWKLKSVTVSQDSVGNYFASVLFEYEQEDIPSVSKSSTNAIGLDYKSDGLYMDSNGNKAGVHKYYRESHKKLAKQQRRLSRKAGSKKNETKSSNYFKQMRKVNRIYRKIANQRLDSLHKKSTEIANQYDIVCVEDLDMKAIGNKGFGNGKATFDNGYGMFLNMLEYKLKERGKYFVKIDKWYPSSQICHCCGSVKKLDLKDRVYTCDCGYTGDRDHNAAINILTEGLRILQSL